MSSLGFSRIFARLRGPLAVAFAGAALAGCAGPAETTTSGVALPARFENGGAKTSQAQTSRWWRRFGSRELDALMARAEVGNFDVKAALASLEQAQAQASLAQAPLWPTLSMNDSTSRSRSSGTLTPGVVTHPQGRNSFGAVLNASYLIDLWGRNRDLREAAAQSASASAYQVEVVRAGMRASLVNAWLTIAAQRERVRVARESLKAAERVLRVYLQRKAAGTSSDLEIAQQTALLENQRAAIPPLRESAEQARASLALLIGAPIQSVHPKVSSATALRAPAAAPGVPAVLLARRPDVREAEAQLAGADANVSAARKALLPSIQLTGSGGLQSGALSQLLRPESAIYSLAAGLAQPIFDGGALSAQLAISKAQREQLLEAYRKAIVSALTDVESALIALRESAAREAGVARALSAARRAFALSEDRLKQGTIDLPTLLSAQQTLFQAQDALVQARFARLQAAVSLFQALGGDWSDESATSILEAARAPQGVPPAPLAVAAGGT